MAMRLIIFCVGFWILSSLLYAFDITPVAAASKGRVLNEHPEINTIVQKKKPTLNRRNASTSYYSTQDTVNVTKFAGKDIGSKIVMAYNSLPAKGGVIDCRSVQGYQYITHQITIRKPNITLLFGNITITLSGVGVTHVPPGAVILVYGNGFSCRGRGGNTRFTMAKGCQASAFGLIECSHANLSNFLIDGNKSHNVGQTDDTWQTGISCISYTPLAHSEARHTFSYLIVQNFVQYGISYYGDMCNGNIITHCRLNHNGKAEDRLSVGAGAVINKETKRNRIKNSILAGNKYAGVFISNAGGKSNCHDNIVSNCNIYNNDNGIISIEQANFGATTNTGQYNNVYEKNQIHNNTIGIRIGCYNNVGFIGNTIVVNNNIYNNKDWGILIQGQPGSSTVKSTQLRRNIIRDNGTGLSIGPNVNNSINDSNNIYNNRNNNLQDLGARN
ncbi:MAG: hypothetical protein NVSMB24_05870 [Mucilaginibacter sp.]